jgi:prepilin signal peptidase PulO-like enzyme (type II secretory pathway)
MGHRRLSMMYDPNIALLSGFFVFVFGAIIGSFLNVVILRYRTGRSALRGTSACFSCAAKLQWVELLPILSYFALRGECRSCRSHISMQYPLVELAGALSFLFIYLKLGFTFPALLAAAASSLLIVIFAYDMRHRIIPDSFSFSFSFVALVYLIFGLATDTSAMTGREVLSAFAAGPLLSLPFFLLWAVSRGEWMGFGDGKLAFGMGWLVGLSGGFAAVILAFWIGAAVSLGLLALEHFRAGGKRLTMKSEIPFAPFLITGLAIAFFSGVGVMDLVGWFAM